MVDRKIELDVRKYQSAPNFFPISAGKKGMQNKEIICQKIPVVLKTEEILIKFQNMHLHIWFL